MTHPLHDLIDMPVTGEVPDTDPEYGWMHTVVDQLYLYRQEISDELDFDGIHTEADGTVHLLYKGSRVATATMSNHHADARLVIGDPK